MNEHEWLADRFQTHRSHLRAVAYRILGSGAEADDAVQEAWLRLGRADATAIDNLGAWLTTVVGRISLDMLRSRAARREQLGIDALADTPVSAPALDPEQEAVVADTVGAALLVVLDSLRPAERLAFVLHDMFAVPFDDIAAILGRSPDAAKQLASRARRKVQGGGAAVDDAPADPERRRRVVDAFLAASRAGELDALVALLDPDVVLHADATAASMGSPATVRGAAAVAATFSGRALAAQTALVDGAAAILWAAGGRPRVVWELTFRGDTIVRMDMLAAPETLDDMQIVVAGA